MLPGVEWGGNYAKIYSMMKKKDKQNSQHKENNFIIYKEHEWSRLKAFVYIPTTEQNGVMSPNFWGHGQIFILLLFILIIIFFI